MRTSVIFSNSSALIRLAFSSSLKFTRTLVNPRTVVRIRHRHLLLAIPNKPDTESRYLLYNTL